MDYPQRWLREHKAVVTDKGWARASGELLKCQKGLESDDTDVVPDQEPGSDKPEVTDPDTKG